MRKILFPLALVALMLGGCDSPQLQDMLGRIRSEAPAAPRAPVKVKTLTVGLAETLPGTVFPGELEPEKSVVLTAPYGGTLASVPVRKGIPVAGGQTVAVVRSQSVESALQIAEATLNQARDANTRLQKVYASGAIPEVQKIDIETQLAKAEAAAEAARKAKSDGAVRTPYGGVIGELYVANGEEVLPGQRIALLMDVSALRVRIDVHESDINSLSVGMPAVISVPALGLDNLTAVVSERGYVASPISRSYSCTLRMLGRHPDLMPGMVIKACFNESRADTDPRIVVPATAVLMDAEGKYVWTVQDGLACKVRIVPDGYSGRGIVVASGLSAGDKVIVEGYQKVSTGMKVTE